MQGTILILDGVATNRIMLKVQLSSAYYHVVQT
ncbi:MAG: two-component system cell cycle response regulator, partial [Paracoccaceae bacterium]